MFCSRDQIEDTEMSLQVALAEEKSATASLAGPETNLKTAEVVKSDMAIVDKYREELKTLENKLRDVENKLPTTGL